MESRLGETKFIVNKHKITYNNFVAKFSVILFATMKGATGQTGGRMIMVCGVKCFDCMGYIVTVECCVK